FTPAHVLLARLYYKLNRSKDGEREREIIQKLQEDEQKKQPSGNTADPALKDSIATVDLQQKADSLKQQNDLAGAREAYEAQLRLTPRRLETLSGLGEVLARQGEYDGAISRYRQALEIDSKQDAIRTNLGIAYYKAGQFADAQREL